MKLNKKDKLPKEKRVYVSTDKRFFEIHIYYHPALNIFRLFPSQYADSVVVVSLTPVLCIHNTMVFVARNLSRLDKEEIKSLLIIYDEKSYTFQEFFDTYCRGESIADWASKDVKV